MSNSPSTQLEAPFASLLSMPPELKELIIRSIREDRPGQPRDQTSLLSIAQSLRGALPIVRKIVFQHLVLDGESTDGAHHERLSRLFEHVRQTPDIALAVKMISFNGSSSIVRHPSRKLDPCNVVTGYVAHPDFPSFLAAFPSLEGIHFKLCDLDVYTRAQCLPSHAFDALCTNLARSSSLTKLTFISCPMPFDMLMALLRSVAPTLKDLTLRLDLHDTKSLEIPRPNVYPNDANPEQYVATWKGVPPSWGERAPLKLESFTLWADGCPRFEHVHAFLDFISAPRGITPFGTISSFTLKVNAYLMFNVLTHGLVNALNRVLLHRSLEVKTLRLQRMLGCDKTHLSLMPTALPLDNISHFELGIAVSDGMPWELDAFSLYVNSLSRVESPKNLNTLAITFFAQTTPASADQTAGRTLATEEWDSLDNAIMHHSATLTSLLISQLPGSIYGGTAFSADDFHAWLKDVCPRTWKRFFSGHGEASANMKFKTFLRVADDRPFHSCMYGPCHDIAFPSWKPYSQYYHDVVES